MASRLRPHGPPKPVGGPPKPVGSKPVRPRKPSPQLAPVKQIKSAATGEQVKVGDRVIVNGKAGVVAYLGKTEFEEGEWAGTILDTPQGRNNGSVAGVRYFQCKPHHGLFTRLTKLKVIPSSSPAQPQPQIDQLDPPISKKR